VSAPGLMTIPSAQARASWMKVDQRAFVVALKGAHFMRRGGGRGDAHIDVGQRHCAVDVRLARAEQIQVWAVE
jgi:hypothetical protein